MSSTPTTRSFRFAGSGAAAAIVMALALAGGAVSAAAPSVVGIAAAIVNDVRIRSAAARQFGKAALRQRVALADQVQTGGGSRLQLLLLDKSKFTVGANARLTIDRFVYDPSGGSMSASVAKGAFRFMSGRSGGRKDSSIRTPAATIGIRGTLIDGVVGEQAVTIARGEREVRGNVRHDPATATLIILRGPGPRRQGNDAVGEIDVTAGGKTVTLDRPLDAAYIPYAGAQPIVFSISSPGIARLNDLLLEPREILSDPNAGPAFYPPSNDRRDRYDAPYPPPGGGFDGDGPGPRGGGGGYIPNLPGLNGYPGGIPDRPQRERERPQRTPSTPDSTQTPPNTDTTPPATSGGSGNNLYLRDDSPPPTTDTPGYSSEPTPTPNVEPVGRTPTPSTEPPPVNDNSDMPGSTTGSTVTQPKYVNPSSYGSFGGPRGQRSAPAATGGSGNGSSPPQTTPATGGAPANPGYSDSPPTSVPPVTKGPSNEVKSPPKSQTSYPTGSEVK